MTSWNCGILGCGGHFETPIDLIVHQATDHEECTCSVCGESLPAGFLAIRHAFTEHNRTDYVRSYGATPGHIRQRETVVELIEERINLPAVLSQLDGADDRMAAADD